MLCRLVRHAFPPQFSGRSFLGWSRWQVDPRGGFIGGSKPWNAQQCRGHEHWKWALGVPLWGWPLFWQLFPKGWVGEGQEVLQREGKKKTLQFAFGCLESGLLEGQLKSDRCLFQRLKKCPDRKATLRRYTIWRDLGEAGVFWCTVLKHEICHETGFRKTLAILGAPCTCLAHGHPACSQRSQTRKKTIPTRFHSHLNLKELNC